VISFLAVKRGCLLTFERREDGFSEGNAVIIRLIGPQDVLQIWMCSLLMRRIFSVVSFFPTLVLRSSLGLKKRHKLVESS
jgi:hypothetical protein